MTLPGQRACAARLWWPAACAALLCSSTVQAQGSASALEREAIPVRHPGKVVLLGAAQCGNTLLAVGERGVAAQSSDQGRTWRQAVRVPVSTSLTAVRCRGAKTAWAVGHGGVVLVSQDGGAHWVRQLDGRQAAAAMLASAKAGAMANTGADAGALAEAQRLVADGPDKPFFDLLLASEREAFVVGAYSLFFHTVDGGNHWQAIGQRLENPKRLHLHAIAAAGAAVVIAGEQGLLFRSDDQGQTFTRLASPYQGSWFTLAMPDANTVVVAGLRGNVWATRDAGKSWARMDGAPASTFIGSSVLGQDRVLLLNQSGQLFLARLDKGALEALQTPAMPPATGLLALPAGGALVLTVQGALLAAPPINPGARGARS